MPKEKTLTMEEFHRFLEYLPKIEGFTSKLGKPSPLPVLDFSILYKLMFYCALRLSEVKKLKKSDFNLANRILKVQTSRTTKIQDTTIPLIILDELESFLKNKKDDDIIFPVTRQIILKYAQDTVALAKIEISDITEKKDSENLGLLVFRESYEKFLYEKKLEKGLVDLKLRNITLNRYGNFKIENLIQAERKIFKNTISNIKIFLSHSDKDKKIASELKSKLSKYGLSVFLAHEDIEGGSDWVSKLYEEIQKSKVFIMLLTKNYHPSKYTDQETGIAINYKKIILPICIDDTRPYGFASSKQAVVCSLPFEDSIVEKIVNISKMKLVSSSSDLDKLILKLINSGSYTESATIAAQLQKYDDFSESQLRQLAFSALNNPQVYYSYVADAVINEIIGDNLDKVNPILRDQLEKFYDPSHPSLTSNFH